MDSHFSRQRKDSRPPAPGQSRTGKGRGSARPAKGGQTSAPAGQQEGARPAQRVRGADAPRRNSPGPAPRGRPQGQGAKPAVAKDRYPQAEFARREGMLEDLPAVMLVNRSLKGYPFCKEFPWCLRLVVAYRADSTSGLPLPKEERALEAFEQNLFGLLRKNVNGHYIGHTSWRGSREFLFYVDEGGEAEDPLEAFADTQKRELEYALEEDARWTHATHYFDYTD